MNPASEVLPVETLGAMPDTELLLHMQRLRRAVDSVASQIAEAQSGGFSRRPDWRMNAQARLKDCEAALQQVRVEGARRIRVAREAEPLNVVTGGKKHAH